MTQGFSGPQKTLLRVVCDPSDLSCSVTNSLKFQCNRNVTQWYAHIRAYQWSPEMADGSNYSGSALGKDGEHSLKTKWSLVGKSDTLIGHKSSHYICCRTGQGPNSLAGGLICRRTPCLPTQLHIQSLILCICNSNMLLCLNIEFLRDIEEVFIALLWGLKGVQLQKCFWGGR